MSAAKKAAAAQLFAEGLAHQRAARLDEARHCYERGLGLDPGNPDALFLLGQVLFDSGDTGLGERKMRAALSVRPTAGNYRGGLAISLFRIGRFAAAASEFAEALRYLPGVAELWRGLALSSAQVGDAATTFRAAAEWQRLAPSDADAPGVWRSAGAQLAYREGLKEDERGCFESAIEAYGRALEFDPLAVAIQVARANLLARMGCSADARHAYEAAVAVHPDNAAAHFNFAMFHLDEGRRLDALDHLEMAARLDPENGLFATHLLFQLMHLCRWAEMEDLIRRVVAAIEEDSADIPPFIVLSMPGTTPRLQRKCAENHSRRLSRVDAGSPSKSVRVRRPGRWRIGYLSSDFKQHATAFLMIEMLEAHDRSRFETFGLSYGVDDRSEMRGRIGRSFEHFLELSAAPEIEAVERIGALDLDVLIDLKGYTEGNHSEWLQHRLAPVQINWLGYPGTLGAPWVDYLIADAVVAPEASQWMYSERILYLPGTYQPNARVRDCEPATTRADEDLPEDALVLCSFNQTYKITPEIYGVWLDLLCCEPRAVLWLWASNPWAEKELRSVAAHAGIAPERIIFAEGRPQAAHLARLSLADLALDTFPCNGHTTTSDALWAGVPVVTLCGEAFASRVAASLLYAAGLGDLVATDAGQYRAIVKAWLSDATQRRRLRAIAAEFRGQSPVCDNRRFVRNFEDQLASLV
ncbi:tetratricopeptide repeat protein [Propionivibrio dicarboxylicus]|uniref:protein O-GlcNAc transferase n=1 Tax=Propionivibrio dicarboxylicus TaxID=83767 RepID=A0A1G8HAN4_9RHOO|nr:tetratricopeptide repeat protein [Propionivibrio dicarboxylicus]SDI03707.1 Predicted O-linked N-acetylglucosamine transferase, SPINDLY family [Propionivibrio dicarboxylicus]